MTLDKYYEFMDNLKRIELMENLIIAFTRRTNANSIVVLLFRTIWRYKTFCNKRCISAVKNYDVILCKSHAYIANFIYHVVNLNAI